MPRLASSPLTVRGLSVSPLTGRRPALRNARFTGLRWIGAIILVWSVWLLALRRDRAVAEPGATPVSDAVNILRRPSTSRRVPFSLKAQAFSTWSLRRSRAARPAARGRRSFFSSMVRRRRAVSSNGAFLCGMGARLGAADRAHPRQRPCRADRADREFRSTDRAQTAKATLLPTAVRRAQPIPGNQLENLAAHLRDESALAENSSAAASADRRARSDQLQLAGVLPI